MSSGSTSGQSRLRILLVGVGGQGVITGARVLGAALHALGHPVVVGQLHGMSQRGGSVEAPVLVGPGSSSFVPAGSADVVIGFEPLEALRALPFMGPQTLAIVNRSVIVPVSLSQGGHSYPPLDSLFTRIRDRAGQLLPVDGAALAVTAGSQQALNMVLLGVLAGRGVLPVAADSLWEAMRATATSDPGPVNRDAFRLGVHFQGPAAATPSTTAT